MCGSRSRLRAFKGSGAPIQCDMMGSIGTVPLELGTIIEAASRWVASDSKPALFSADNSRSPPSHKQCIAG
jgi:hypothetical protein